MLNEGLVGLRETVRPIVTADRHTVLLQKSLLRPYGDAALPPGQSLELSFMVALLPFSIRIQAYGDFISTDERRKGTLPGATQTRLEFAPALPAYRSADVGTTLDGWVALARRRLPEIGLTPGGWLTEPPDLLDPVEPPPDPVVPFKVTLTSPAGNQMVYDQPFASELQSLPFPADISVHGVSGYLGLWKITVENTNASAMRPSVKIQSIHSIRPLEIADIPTALLNTLASTIMKKVTPTISYRDGSIVVETPTHFLQLLGVDLEHSLPSLITKVVDAVPSYTPVLAAIESRARLLRRLEARRSELSRVLEEKDASTLRRLRVQAAMTACIERVKALHDDNAVFCLVVDGLFTTGAIELNFVGEVARIENQLPQVALIFDKYFRLSDVISNLSVDLSPALIKVDALLALGGVLTAAALGSFFGPVGVGVGVGLALAAGVLIHRAADEIDVDSILQDEILGKKDSISRYAQSFFERLSAVGAIAVECEMVTQPAAHRSDLLRIAYYDPTTGRPPRPFDWVQDAANVGAQEQLALTMPAPGGTLERREPTAFGYRRRGKRVTELRHTLGRKKPGPIPADFVVRDPNSLATLDRHDCIVVLMMENRSYDHMFYELGAKFPGRGYEPPPATFSNPPPPGFSGEFGVWRNEEIGIGNTLIFTHPAFSFHSSDPSHSFEHTMFQIGGGTAATSGSGDMKGFARDFALKSDSPQIVMSYLGLDSLPVYRALVESYAVCDQWFAALPVGTQPNRLAALQGDVPFLHNLDHDDPSIGFLEDYSVFDMLTEQGISWKFFEGDIGTIRLYDRFRLDVQNVLPLNDLEQTLRIGRDTGQLPRVMFIEPEFLFGNDDHPPVDIRDGQDFIKHIIGQFIDFGLMNRTLFVITYDEHGGFFDHVAPPGTPRGDNAWINNVASLFPQDPNIAPRCMGVRVPSIVMSPLISNEAKHTVLDHTSIIKTILLHNRALLATEHFSRFGERVMQGSHLGELMDLVVPRTIDYGALARAMGYHSEDSWFNSRGSTIVDGDTAALSRTHPASVLHNIGMPRARRFVSST